MDDLPDPICILDPDLKIVEANPALATLLGRSWESLIGADYQQLLPDASGHWFVATVFGLSPDQPVERVTLERGSVEDSPRTSELRLRGIFDDDGQPVEYQCIERLLGEPAAAAPDPLAGSGQALDQAASDACNDADVLQSGLHILNYAFSIDALYEGTLSVLTKIVPFVDAGILMPTKQGGLEMAVNHAGKLELEPAVSAGIFAEALRGNAVVVEDLSLHSEWAAASRSSDYVFASALIVPLESVDQPALIVCVHTQPGFFEDKHLRALKTFAPIAAQAVQWAKQRHQLELHRDQLEELVRDRTSELATQKERLAQALEKELELNGLQRQFVSMVCHEFRTPLAIIDGSAQHVLRRRDKINPDRLGDKVEKIRTAVVRLTDLIESVLDAARLEAGNLKFEPRPSRLGAMIEDVCSSHRELNRDYTIITDVEALPDDVFTDLKLMRQAISNLVSNAVKYSPPGTQVRVCGSMTDDDHVLISVRDNGVGIPSHELSKLFDRFFRGSTSTGLVGTGIGLHLVKTMVDLHGGTIDVESTPGEGTTFEIRFPAKGQAAPADDDQGMADIEGDEIEALL